MQKIFFTDLDGTLLNDKKQISSQNRQAIQKLTASGHKIVLTTGRSLPSAIHQANLLHLTFDGCYLIAFNGAEIYDSYHKKTLYKNRIPIDAVNRIFSLCEKNHIHVHTYDDQYVITRYVTKELKRYCNEMVCDYKLMSDVTETLGEGPSKLLLLDYDNHMSLENMKKEILRTESNIVDSFFSGDGLLEVVLKGTSKGNG